MTTIQLQENLTQTFFELQN